MGRAKDGKTVELLRAQPPPQQSSVFIDGTIDFIAGSLGAVSLVFVGQPFDTIKVKMQTFPDIHKNMFKCYFNTLKSDGVLRGLYAGTVPALAANVAENSVLFLSYGFCQKFIQKFSNLQSVDDLSAVHNAWAGFFASFFSSLTLCPTELIKCKLQAMNEINKQAELKGEKLEKIGSAQLIANIVKAEGITGLFRGLTPTLIREMPGYFFFFGAYEAVREFFVKPGETKEDIGLINTMVAGAIGGATFWVSVYPIDVVKSRIQVSNLQTNLMTTISNMIRQEGFSSLYNGLLPTLIRTIPATAALFVTYEYSKHFMHQYYNE